MAIEHSTPKRVPGLQHIRARVQRKTVEYDGANSPSHVSVDVVYEERDVDHKLNDGTRVPQYRETARKSLSLPVAWADASAAELEAHMVNEGHIDPPE